MIQALRSSLGGDSRALLCLLLLVVGVWCASCAPKAPRPDIQALHPDEVWQRFLQRFPDTNRAPAFSLEASLHYLGAKNQSRVILDFWGNLDLPLRMDLKTGFGSLLSLWREDPSEFMAYIPDKESVYLHQDSRRGMIAFGIDLPLSLRELALLLNGHWQGLIPGHYATVRKKDHQGLYFTFRQNGREYRLLLDGSGTPLALRTPAPMPWDLEFSGDLEGKGFPNLPAKITMRNDSGDRAILLIKDIKQRPDPWPDAALRLDLPENTRMMLLDDVRIDQ